MYEERPSIKMKLLGFEGNTFYYLDEFGQDQFVMLNEKITSIKPIGLLGNECLITTVGGKYYAKWLKNHNKTRIDKQYREE